MFILVVFGYRQSKIFAIDCLTATLIDTIWISAIKDIFANLKLKEELMAKEKQSHIKRITKNESRIEQIDKSLKEEEDKLAGEGQADKKKDAKAPPKPAPAKKGKDAPPANPLEAEKLELSTEIQKSKEALTKYDDKVEKIKVVRVKMEEIEKNESLVVELFDKQGERKFAKTKLDTIANSFLSDKNTYVLGYYQPTQQANEEEQIQVLEFDGFCVRTVEEDETAVDEPLIPKKDDKKKGKKGK